MPELAALESYSEHPIAKAIAAQVPVPAMAAPSVRDIRVHPGRGITGLIDGTEYFIGNAALAGTTAAAQPHPTVYFGWNGQVRGSMTFGDRPRPQAAELCANLHSRGIRTVLLSGDSMEATRDVAHQIGATEWIAEASPDRKVEVIRDLQQSGAVVAMVGDGVNDAASLAQADLGIALGSGADIALQAAPLVLMNRSLAGATETLDLARRTYSIVRQNLFWAFAYNAIGITLAISGVLSPIFAAAAMVLSSLSVLGNSHRLRR
jgi:P-type E1-E2 ATPase